MPVISRLGSPSKGHSSFAASSLTVSYTHLDALATFQGVARRMDIKGEVGGVLIVEDFAHHPTAIRATIAAARTRWPGRRLWAVVEFRSNTMRGKTFESELPDALAGADCVLLGAVSRAQLLTESSRLNPARVAVVVRELGAPARAMNSAAEIADTLGREAEMGDVIPVSYTHLDVYKRQSMHRARPSFGRAATTST